MCNQEASDTDFDPQTLARPSSSDHLEAQGSIILTDERLDSVNAGELGLQHHQYL